MKKFNNKGFSLIELVVAIGIIAIAGTALFNGFIMSGRVHMNTVQLQMAEDTAQKIAEEFNSNYITVLKTKYSTSTGVITDSIVDDVRTVTFADIPYTYEARTGTEGSSFLVDIKLTSKKTAKGTEAVRTTTYKQSSNDAATFYQVGDTVGTNTFIIPEVTNIYDGDRIVVSDEINQYDNAVWSDLLSALRSKLDEVNNNINVVENKYNVNEFENSFLSLYWPYTNITNPDQLIKKTKVFVKYESGGSGTLDFYYVITIEFEFNFDFPLVTMGGLLGPNLSEVITVDDLATVAGATSTYEIKKTGSSQYTVSYKKLLDEAETGDSTTYGTFGGKIDTSSQNPSEPPLEIKADGTGDAVPYLYILYTPFDLYSDDSGECNDEIMFDCAIPGGDDQNIVRVFFVEQKLTNLVDTNKKSKVVNCDIDSPYPEETFKVYTNSTDVIDETSNAIGEKNYLTNSYGKSRYNLYDMEITVKNMQGVTVATYNTVKED